MKLTYDDLVILLADGTITEAEANAVEIITRDEMLARYSPEIQKALGMRAGLRPPPVR